MNNIIYIRDITKRALSDQDGLKLREAIRETLDKSNSSILDFSDINYFATPFFNISIGYYVLNLSPSVFINRISVQNISDIGKKTYERAVQNAIQKFELPQNSVDTISKIVHDENKFN